MSGELAELGRVHLFPVRHHSPRSSAALKAFLSEVEPSVILIEGPEDATSLIDVLVDEATRPPVAILGYRTDGTPGSSLWPFAAYSPEYVALKWGTAAEARLAFIDIPINRALSVHLHDSDEDGPDPDAEDPDANPDIEEEETTEGVPVPGASGKVGFEVAVDIHKACAEARGFRSFEEFWEASFEAPAYDTRSFREALLAYAELVRLSHRQPLHRVRDAFMARRILDAISAGTAPEQIAVVVGAAHAAAFAAKDVDLSLAQHLPPKVESAATLIPFSFPRLAEQLGYGAGNRAPQYYQRAHDAGCNFRRATLEVLVEFSEHLRLRGFMASLADTIEAYRLAVTLAGHRGKAEPGLDEIREATIATMCRGDGTHVDGFLWPSVIGRHVGRVADRIGKNSLQEEFWREIEARGLPQEDSVTGFVLKLNDPVQVGTSVFLHRLRVAGVPYASYTGKYVGGQRSSKKKSAPGEEAGGLDALRRTSEAWEAQHTPSTEVALVEKIVLGDTLEQVTTRVLSDRLNAAHTTGDAADVLQEAVVTSCPETVVSALSACDRLAAGDDDLPSLARASSVLSYLASFGSSRALSRQGDKAIPALCQKTFDRAVLRVEDACTGTEEAVQKPKVALRTLHDVAVARHAIVDRQAWFDAARALVASYSVNPGAAGLAAGLLYMAQVIRDEDVNTIVAQRLSNTLDPAGAAGFLQGFFEADSRGGLVKNRTVVAALDSFLTGIDKDRFRDALPVLRRAFSPLGSTERRYLLENVLAIRNIGDKAREAQAILLEKDKEKLKEMSADLGKAMDDLDDLL